MRLAEALKLAAPGPGATERRVEVLCGFEPLHLATFIKAHVRLRFPQGKIIASTGLYGDLEGNLARAKTATAEGSIAVIEWGDLDPRLSFRNAGGWSVNTSEDIGCEAQDRLARTERAVADIAAMRPIAVVGPTLMVPPISHQHPQQASRLELRLAELCSELERRLAALTNVRVVSRSALAMASPPAQRHDVKMDLQAGFPYTLTHADTVAQFAVGCLFPNSPKKGLITDLDQTLWKGILGDAGVEGVSWSLETKGQVHALYQQLLASLAESGVLLAIASKNEARIVAEAMVRPDLLVRAEGFFPVEASWGLKSDAVGRILQKWNIAADSVVFVDDSPMELAEVGEKHPGLECLQFTPEDPSAVLALLRTLRERFGKDAIGDEDKLRLGSLRAQADLSKERTAPESGDFTKRLDAKLRFDTTDAAEQRALELVNKTNQFNLNGYRFTEAEWTTVASEGGRFLLTVSYEDRFGPLGRIAVVSGRTAGSTLNVDIWVMSCRAFSRKIEYATLRFLFEKSAADEIAFEYRATDRNRPLSTLLLELTQQNALSSGPVKLGRSDFDRLCPTLFHEVTERWTPCEKN